MAKIFKTRIFSGIQPTGVPHIGNYFGAIKQWVDVSMISNGQCNGSESMEKPIFCVVDLHALTSNDNSHSLLENIYSTFASLLACQINLNNSILFKQSSVLEHTYLSWILGSNLPTSRLNNLSHFRVSSIIMKISGYISHICLFSIVNSSDGFIVALFHSQRKRQKNTLNKVFLWAYLVIQLCKQPIYSYTRPIEYP